MDMQILSGKQRKETMNEEETQTLLKEILDEIRETNRILQAGIPIRWGHNLAQLDMEEMYRKNAEIFRLKKKPKQ